MLERTLPIPEMHLRRRPYQWVLAALVTLAGCIVLVLLPTPTNDITDSQLFRLVALGMMLVILIAMLAVGTLAGTDMLRRRRFTKAYCAKLAVSCRDDHFDIVAATMQPLEGVLRTRTGALLELTFPDGAPRYLGLHQLAINHVEDTGQLPQLTFDAVEVRPVSSTLVLISYTGATEVLLPRVFPAAYYGRYLPLKTFCQLLIERQEDRSLASVR